MLRSYFYCSVDEAYTIARNKLNQRYGKLFISKEPSDQIERKSKERMQMDRNFWLPKYLFAYYALPKSCEITEDSQKLIKKTN